MDACERDSFEAPFPSGPGRLHKFRAVGDSSPACGRMTIVSGTLFAQAPNHSCLALPHDVFSRFPPLAKEGQGGFNGVGKCRHR
jgi:hypothetical protein